MDRRHLLIGPLIVGLLLVASPLLLASFPFSQEASTASAVLSSGMVVYVGHADIDPNVSEKVYIHPGAVPTSVKLYLWGEKFSPQFYTELGAHTHALLTAGNLGDTRVSTNADGAGSWQDEYISGAGVNGGGLSTVVKSWLNSMTIEIDGVDKTSDVLVLANANWEPDETGFGDGTATHPLVITGTGQMDLTHLDLEGDGEADIDWTAGQHLFEFKVPTGGGRVRYNLYLSVESTPPHDSTPVPHLINYQGRLANSTGNPLTGLYDMKFSIYDEATDEGSPLLWTEWYSSTRQVTVTNGVFSVLLGELNPIPAMVFDGSDRWLGVKVENDAEMTPRRRIVSVGYAYRAESANTGGSGIPSGMIGMFDTGCPSGWTRVTAFDNRFPMGGTPYGTTGGSSTHTHNGTTGISSSGVDPSSNPGDARAPRGHMHSFTTDPASSLPPYLTVVFCRKE